MFFILLIDKTIRPKSFWDNARNHMNVALFRNGEEDQNITPRPLLYLSIDNRIPFFSFESTNDEEDFIRMFPHNQTTINVFTTMPAEQLELFFGRCFRINTGPTRYFVYKKLLDNDLIMYENRFFTITSQNIYQGMPIENRIEKKDSSAHKKGYKNYLKPVVASFADIEGIKDMFFDTPQLPFALPARDISVSESKSYFTKRNTSIRQFFRNNIQSSGNVYKPNLAPFSVIYKLLTLTEKGIYREYLNEGGHWSVEAYKENLSKIEGYTGLVFHYQHSKEISMAGLRNTLLIDQQPCGDDIMAIKTALKADMEIKEISETHIEPDAVCRVYSEMKAFEKENFANTKEGIISWIEEFVENCEADDKAYILNDVLAPYRNAADNRGNDDINAARNFNEHFFKCPLAANAEIDWNDVVLKFFIRKNGCYSLKDVLHEYRLADYNPDLGEATDNLSIKCDNAEKILPLRLLLPLNTNIELIQSNILDSNNCILENNLILE